MIEFVAIAVTTALYALISAQLVVLAASLVIFVQLMFGGTPDIARDEAWVQRIIEDDDRHRESAKSRGERLERILSGPATQAARSGHNVT